MLETIGKLLDGQQGGSFLVRNEGGYVARFEVNFTLDGKHFSKKSGDFPLGQNRSIEVPAGADDVHLKVEEAVFFGTWSTIFSKNFAEPVSECYKIWGTTLDPKYAGIAC